MMPTASQPRCAAAFATDRITAFNPGQSPPPVTMPILLLMKALLKRVHLRTYILLSMQQWLHSIASIATDIVHEHSHSSSSELACASEWVAFQTCFSITVT